MDYSLKIDIPWRELLERLQEADQRLTDEDLAYEPGQDKELLERVAKKMGKDIPSVKGWIESVAFNNRIAY